MEHIKSALLRTLSYSDIFDYPLTKAQLWRYLLIHKRISFHAFEKTLTTTPEIKEKNNFYFLSGRSSIVAKRQERQRKSLQKIAKAKPILLQIAKIPTVVFVGISGSLAMHNADAKADVDIFLITKPSTLWITRLMVLLLLQRKHVRRKRNSIRSQNTLCVNMLIDMTHVRFPTNRQSMYTAHEIIQMLPFYSRSQTYERFLKENSWVREFLPNAYREIKIVQDTGSKIKNALHALASQYLSIFEPLAKYMQLRYMKRHRTTETIRNGFVAFHPSDYTSKILMQFEKRKQDYGI